VGCCLHYGRWEGGSLIKEKRKGPTRRLDRKVVYEREENRGKKSDIDLGNAVEKSRDMRVSLELGRKGRGGKNLLKNFK